MLEVTLYLLSMTLLSTPCVIPHSPYSTMRRGSLCFPYFTDENIESLGGKAQGDLIIYCPNQETNECERVLLLLTSGQQAN